jgi:hypothetical protein
MSENSWFYFFSANAQVFASLIAILGVFTIYAFEWMQDSIESNRRDLVKLFRDNYSIIEHESLSQQLEIADKFAKETWHGQSKGAKALEYSTLIKEQLEKKENVSKDFKKLFIFKIIVLALSLLFLPWCSIVSTRIDLPILIVVLLASIVALAWMGFFIWSVLSKNSGSVFELIMCLLKQYVIKVKH